MGITEKLTYHEKGKIKQLVHNVIRSNELQQALVQAIIRNCKNLKLDKESVKQISTEIKLKIRGIEAKNKDKFYFM